MTGPIARSPQGQPPGGGRCEAYRCDRTDTTLHVVAMGANQGGRSLRLCPRHQEGYEVPTAQSDEPKS